MLAMVRYPEVARRAQAEIDEIIGRDRLPTLEDKGSLPYIDCIVKETLRWNPPTPLGIPYQLACYLNNNILPQVSRTG